MEVVPVTGEPIAKALRRFRHLMVRSGLVLEANLHRYFLSPRARKRLKQQYRKHHEDTEA